MTINNTVKNYTKYAKEYEFVGPQSFYHKFIEKPGMYSILPDLSGKKVLCIGVGTGDEAEYLRNLGADVTGIDNSEGLLNLAKQKYPKNRFELMDLDKLDFPEESFDFAYSSLALHYSDNLLDLFKKIYSVLKVGGSLQFSTTHPVLDGAERFTDGDVTYKVIGNKKDRITGKSCPLGDYFNKKKVQIKWSDEFVIEFNHYTITEWINSMIEAGLKITRISEPIVIEDAKKIDETKYLQYVKKPLFFIVVGKKD